MVKLRRLEAIETNQDPSSLWQVPRSSFVHILPPRSIEHLAASRQSAIARLSYLRGEWESIQRAARLAPTLHHADITLGNLEGTLSVGGASKCRGPSGGTCFAFQAPPHTAFALRRLGFDLVNQANNHAQDFGPSGHAQTIAALQAQINELQSAAQGANVSPVFLRVPYGPAVEVRFPPNFGHVLLIDWKARIWVDKRRPPTLSREWPLVCRCAE